ncbi:ribonuclease H-like domain-containing protein [Tanacetum coccineum]
MAYSSTSSNSEVSTDSNCSSSCLENVKILKEQNEQLLKDLRTSKLNVIAYKNRKNNGAPIIKDWVSDNEEDDVTQAKIEKKTIKPSFAKMEFVKSKQQEKTARKTINHISERDRRQGVIDSGCSRHMTGNMFYLTDYEEIDGGYVAFGGNPKGGKITGKGTIKTGGLTYPCKSTSDESELWHRRLGHINFKTMNKLVKGNLVSPVTILNTIDHLGKFDGKADEGFFVGYSINSKAFRVFNSRTRIVEENLHVQFSENTPNIAGSGPNWLFDIDALTKLMNYKPVVTGNQSNGNAGTKACDDAGKARMETVPGKDYILLPLWTSDPPFSQISKSSPDAGFKPSSDDGKKVDEDSRKDSESIDQEKEDNVNSPNNVNVASTNEVNAIGGKTSIELPDDPNK